MSAAPDAPSLAMAEWFPIDVDVATDRWSFLRMDPDTLEQATFMDDRLPVDRHRAVAMAGAAVAGTLADLPPVAPPAWLFHTSFCGSTLFARALHLPPFQVALKEPLVLRRLADAAYAGERRADALLPTATALLARPWFPASRVTIKPTHVTLGLAGDLMAATPGSRALVLTSSLSDFLVSNLKKSRESQAKLPELTERAFHDTQLLRQLPPAAFQPPDVLCAAALQWAGQRFRVTELLEAVGAHRVQVLEFEQWISRFPQTLVEASRWLGLPAPASALRERASDVAGRHAKAPGVAYSAQRRLAEVEQLTTAYRQPLQQALDWARRFVLPALRRASGVDVNVDEQGRFPA